MWLNVLVVAALAGGLLDFCLGQIDDKPVAQLQPSNELTASISAWDIDYAEFAANPDPPEETSVLVSVSGGVGFSLGGPPQKWETVSFEFESGSPSGWVEYVDAAIDCVTGEEVSLPGEAVLLVHFDEAHKDDRFIKNPVIGDSVTLDAFQVCDRDGVLEWAIAVNNRAALKVDSYPWSEAGYEYSVVWVNVLQGDP